MDQLTRVAVSTRIWVILGILTVLLVTTGVGMIKARSELEGARAALQQAEARVKDAESRLRDALEDKQQVFKELAAQGNKIAESSIGEEKARSALAAVSSDVQVSQQQLAALKARLAKAQTQLRALRKENAEFNQLKADAAALTRELDKTRAELERMRALAEPYRAGAQPTQRPGR